MVWSAHLPVRDVKPQWMVQEHLRVSMDRTVWLSMRMSGVVARIPAIVSGSNPVCCAHNTGTTICMSANWMVVVSVK